MTKCPQCGVELTQGAAFCHKCGATIENDDDRQAHPTGAAAGAASNPGRTGTARQPLPAVDPSSADRFRSSAAARQLSGDDQEVGLWQGDYSAKAMMGTWIAAGLITIAAIVAGILLNFSGMAWAITAGIIAALWLGTLLALWYKQYSVHYELTNQRFVHKRGLLSRVTDRIEVIDMDDITFTQGVVERMLGVGKIVITSSDRTHPEIVLPGIDNVDEVSKLMDDARRKERRRRGLHIEAV
jgi:membrane protein YdbS with pleckstrin-like domain